MEKCYKCNRELTTADGLSDTCNRCREDEYVRQSATTTAIFTATSGWLCPRCGVVHGPFVQRCFCKPSKENRGVCPKGVEDAKRD